VKTRKKNKKKLLLKIIFNQMFKSLRAKLLATFLFFTVLSLLVSALNLWYDYQVSLVHEHRIQIDNVSIKILTSLNEGRKVELYETNNPEFYKNEKSEHLKRNDLFIEEAQESLNFLIYESPLKRNNMLRDDLFKLQNDFVDYASLFDIYVKKLIERGYKEEGLLGEIKTHHNNLKSKLLDKDNSIDNLKTIYRNYLLYADEKYSAEFSYAANKLTAEILESKNLGESNKAEAITLLTSYSQAFDKLVEFDAEAGFKKETGISLKIKHKLTEIYKGLDSVAINSKNYEDDLIAGIRQKFMLLLLFQIVLSLIVSIWLASRITKPVLNLSAHLDGIVHNNFKELKPLKTRISKDEFGKLIVNYNKFLAKLQQAFVVNYNNKTLLQEQNNSLSELNKQLQESEENLIKLNDVKDKFFSVLAHDLRGPFSTIMAFLEVIDQNAESFTPQELKSFTTEMTQTVNDFSTLTNNLLHWSLSQSEGFTYSPENINAHTLLEDCIKVNQLKLNEKEIQLTKLVEIDTEIFTDKNIAEFILRNVLSNAIKLSYNKSKINIKFSENKSHYLISVTDEGVGMNAETVKNLFSMKDSISTSGRNADVGKGIGLVLCKDFVAVAGGEIKVDSELNTGTTITFSLKKFENIALAKKEKSIVEESV
jgi:signal transduction histidine kinase